MLILGFGREGRSTYNYIRKYLPEKILGIGDGREQKIDDNNVEYFCGEDYLSHIGKFDVVMKTWVFASSTASGPPPPPGKVLGERALSYLSFGSIIG